MKKRLSLIIASITIMSVCSFILTGKLIQKNYYDTVAKLNTQPNIKVSLLNYKRGLFHSTSELAVEINSKQFPLRQTITHGPLIAAKTPHGIELKVLAAQLTTTLGSSMQEKIIAYLNNPQPYMLVTFVDFSNQANTWLKLIPVDQTSENQLHVAWESIIAEIKHDLNFNSYNAKISAPNISINNLAWKFNLNNLSMNLSSSAKDNAFENNANIQTKNITFAKLDNVLINLNDVNTDLKLVKDNTDLAIDLTTNIENSQILQQKFAQDAFKLRVNKINQLALTMLPSLNNISPLSGMILAQQLTSQSTDLELQLPKYFTEAMLSYLSFEIYRATPMGKVDARPEAEILQDISNNIGKLVQGALKSNMFIDNGTQYALNTKT